MIFFILLLLILVSLSLYLAYNSMRDVYEIPEGGVVYGLFLIRNPRAFTKETLQELHQKMKIGNQIVSFERLFKGNRGALTIFGPRKLLAEFTSLDLLELEDYTKAKKRYSAWELQKPLSAYDLKLAPSEELWLQFVCQVHSGNFSLQMRAVLISEDLKKKSQESSSKVLRDFSIRSIAPIGKKATKVSPDKLLEIILPPHPEEPQLPS